MTERTLNIALLTATHDHIRKFPELHNQSAWAEGVALPFAPNDLAHRIFDVPMEATEADLRAGNVCGTAFCFAGWAAILDGWHQVRDGDGTWVVDETGYEMFIATAGQESLGLTARQAEYLFDGGCSRDLLDRYVEHLVAHPDAPASDLMGIRNDWLTDQA